MTKTHRRRPGHSTAGAPLLLRAGRLTGLHRDAIVMGGVLLAACAGGADAPDAGAWEFKVDTVRASAGGGARQTAWLRVVGREGPDGEPRTREVVLSFDCRPEDATSTIMTDQALRQGTTEIRVTLDQDPPVDLPAFAGTTPTSGQVVLTVPQDSVLHLLAGHRVAVFEYADGAGSSRTSAEFPLAGLETHRPPFQQACAERGR